MSFFDYMRGAFLLSGVLLALSHRTAPTVSVAKPRWHCAVCRDKAVAERLFCSPRRWESRHAVCNRHGWTFRD